ncbi:uncharacterized protein DNG_06314 [Cephalotrichum gorgonifer]|uniref:Ankyrin repeat protein n=1 Tax=Cephalotrichum gorgonifer TaxID=2041049 RepID=A0AAE8SWB8_9PEZI|nr:uncharacterized protein DNG_06314 [Cephalotrichum gorgonifer]
MVAMESSASPSGASSHATQTGRPSLWTDSDQRKLGRLYVYTTLPIKKILDVIQANGSPQEPGPGKDSANKKLNALLDKEPRWLHPRTRTDMERRMNALATSPTRTTRREFPSPMAALGNESPSPVSPDSHAHTQIKTQNHLQPLQTTEVHQSGAGSHTLPFAHQGVHQDPDMAAFVANPPSDPYSTNHYQPHPQPEPFSPAESQYTDQIVDEPMTDAGPPIAAAAPAQQHATLRRLNPLFRRGTASTDMTTTTLRRALSGYSSGFVTHVRRVIKRYTMPSPQGASPTAETRPATAGSIHESWIHDEQAAPEITCAPPLPGEFLILDRLLHFQGACPPGHPEHESKNCLCRPVEVMSSSIWMSDKGLSQSAQSLLVPGNATARDFEQADVFGNTLMHLFAARNVDHAHIIQLVQNNVPCRGRNSAGQTFLHLLDDSWLTDPQHGTRPLVALLRLFEADKAFLLATDCYGRTLFHALRSKIHDPAPLDHVLHALNVALSRDAFGEVPTPKADVTFKLVRRAHTSVVPEDDEAADAARASPPLARLETDLISSQARLIKFVKECTGGGDPKREDARGRNGLHCLASCILSETSLLARANGSRSAAADTPQSAGGAAKPKSRKRKREVGGPAAATAANQSPLDSSTNRLTLRENLLRGLLEAGVAPNAYDSSGNTPLMAFVAQLPEDDDYKMPVLILQLLIEAGADVNARNRRGETALHVAVRRGKKLATRTLVQGGANVHVRDAAGRGVLDLADERMGGLALGAAGEAGGNKEYMQSEACRAWLSGQGRAVQDPGVLEEWRAR